MKSLLFGLLLISSLAFADGVNGVGKTTYVAATAAFSPPATPTDMCYISGSATKTIKVRKFEFSSTQTTAGINSFFLVKRSTANSSGTCTAATAVPHDSGSMAATAVATTCTGNPTTGSLVGNVRAEQLLSPAPASLADAVTTWDFGADVGADAPIVLKGVAQVLALNFNGAALPTGLSIQCNIVWTEE